MTDMRYSEWLTLFGFIGFFGLALLAMNGKSQELETYQVGQQDIPLTDGEHIVKAKLIKAENNKFTLAYANCLFTTDVNLPTWNARDNHSHFNLKLYVENGYFGMHKKPSCKVPDVYKSAQTLLQYRGETLSNTASIQESLPMSSDVSSNAQHYQTSSSGHAEDTAPAGCGWVQNQYGEQIWKDC